MSDQPQITLAHLVEKTRTFSGRYQTESALRSYMLGLWLAGHFLGGRWMDQHADPEIERRGYFRLNETGNRSLEMQAWRITDLGELLFNLQRVPGFAERVQEMRTTEPEARLAELHIARAILINDWKFEFVKPSGVLGLDYDFEIDSEIGMSICADAKCKIESTELSAKTILNTLSRSTTQLPSDNPGIFFVKFPGEWLDVHGYAEIMIGAAGDYFRPDSRTRVVSIVYYSEPTNYDRGILSHGHRWKEVLNPYRRFGPTHDWRLLNRWRPPPGPNALPAWWVRLFEVTPQGYRGWTRFSEAAESNA